MHGSPVLMQARSFLVCACVRVRVSQPWVLGGYTGLMGPGVLTTCGETLTAPFGRIHWAGTETASTPHPCLPNSALGHLRSRTTHCDRLPCVCVQPLGPATWRVRSSRLSG